mmetsp:Transcript_47974/g.79013  ORF Transcript_47974/g.79013 Transcript_47974/m.79013 type:complete len:81 (+) Transcript_47974:83-325(+)
MGWKIDQIRGAAIVALRVWNKTLPVFHSGFAKQSSREMSESNECPLQTCVTAHRWKREMSFGSNCGLRYTPASSTLAEYY